jgi:hypothetical protein
MPQDDNKMGGGMPVVPSTMPGVGPADVTSGGVATPVMPAEPSPLGQVGGAMAADPTVLPPVGTAPVDETVSTDPSPLAPAAPPVMPGVTEAPVTGTPDDSNI